MKTPKPPKSQGDGVEKKKSSGKKLVQARLPFKILSTPESVEKTPNDGRKRKLSFGKEDTGSSEVEQSTKRRSVRNAANEPNVKRQNDSYNKGSPRKSAASAVVVLSDSNEEDNNVDHDDSGCKENLKSQIAKRKAQINKEDTDDVHSDDVELIESTDEEKSKEIEEPKKKTVNVTPVSIKKPVKKTPQSGKKSTVKGRKSAGDVTPKCKLQIKLPVSSKKNKRRKQISKDNVTAEEKDTHDEMSDDVEIISKELHPEKRPKLDTPHTSRKVGEFNETVRMGKEDATEKIESVEDVQGVEEASNGELFEKGLEVEKEPNNEMENAEKDSSKISPTNEHSSSTLKENRQNSEDLECDSEESRVKSHDISSTASDVEADTETEATVNSEKQTGNGARVQVKSKKTSVAEITSSSGTAGDPSSHKMQKKNLTPKQQKLFEQRQKAREEKERKIQEERLQKQREKEERELAKKRDREEKEEQRRKEREEKEEQRRKEREEKERKRLAETEAKNEEKRKRNEAKEEELRKKEEERKRKEQEKEEAEMKKKKAAMAFTKFFSRTAQDSSGQRIKGCEIDDETHETLAFRPFQIKGDMKLAPIVRKKLTDEERERLSSLLGNNELESVKEIDSTKLYLSELKSGAIKPHKWTLPVQDGIETAELEQDEDSNDVLIVEDELERAGQAIVEEHNLPIERFRAKFYKFSENRRPPYYGTWRKKSTVITPRRPFSQDKKFFDYDVDSDDEWEEEEPGESLDGSDDDKEKESEDDDYEVDNDWFVPHGHLSEEEMQNEDDSGENNDREAQKAKLQILQQEFAQEMKKKTEKIKPRLIGCIWVDENGNQPELCPKIIWDSLNMRAILCHEPPIMEEIEANTEKNAETSATTGQNGEKSTGETKLKPITLTEAMLKELVKLLHGNTHSKNFLIKEFIAYIEANEESVRNGDVRLPLKSAIREKIEEYAEWQVIEPMKNNNEDGSKNTKKQKSKKKLCWVVSKDMLQKMDLESLMLNNNNWKYTLQPRKHKNTHEEQTVPVTIVTGEDSNEKCETPVENCSNKNDSATSVPVQNKHKADIKKFTKVLTAEEKAQQLQKEVEQAKTSNGKNTGTASQTSFKLPETSQTPNPSSGNKTPTVKKRVPLLISVARGQSISTPDKNARISQFLKTINDAKPKEKREAGTSSEPMETDDVILLD